MDKINLVKLMLDYRKGSISGNFSKEEAKETIRQALIDANGGSEKFDRKAFRRNPEIYDLIEEVIQKDSNDGLKGDEFFMNFVEPRDLAEGDSPVFKVKKNSTLVVSDVARGINGIRRQRIGEDTNYTVVPTVHEIKIYDELTRIMSGKADVNDLLDAISTSVKKKKLDDIFASWNGLTASDLGSTYYPTAGAYSEDALFDQCNHVSAANNGEKVMLICTLKGARKLTTGIVSDNAKTDFYNGGYAMKWNGIDVMVVPQRHEVGGTTFMFDDDKIYIIPVGMDKPIKQVSGGNDEIIIGNSTDNADLTVDITYIATWGTVFVSGKTFGIYEIA